MLVAAIGIAFGTADRAAAQAEALTVLDPEGALDAAQVASFRDDLAHFATNYPPTFRDQAQRQVVVQATRNVIDQIRTVDLAALDDASLLTDVGQVLAMAHNLDLGTADLARVAFERALGLAPDDPRTHYSYGLFLVSTQAYQDEGLPHLRRALELGESNAPYTLGMVLAVRGEREEALALLRAYADDHPDDPGVGQVIASIEQDALELRTAEDGAGEVHYEQPEEAGDAAAASDEDDIDFEAWITGFHESPDPDRIAWAMARMDRTADWAKVGHTVAAFLAEVFRAHPDRVAGWAEGARGLSVAARRWIDTAVWWSDVPDADAILAADLARADPELAPAIAWMRETPTQPLLEVPIRNPSVLDMLWGSYFASGNPAYIERITTVLDADAERSEPPAASDDDGLVEVELFRTMIPAAARWSLRSNILQHDDVRRVVEDLAAQAEGARRVALEELLPAPDPERSDAPQGGDG